MSPVDLTHSENHQSHLSRTNCWTLDHWMLGCPVSGATPLARLWNLPCSQTCYHLTPMFRHFHCPKPVRKSSFGTGTYVFAKLHSSLLTKEYSVQPRLNVVKCHIMADYLQTILFIGIYVTPIGIISPVDLYREASHIQYSKLMGKSWPQNIAINCLYLFVWVSLWVLFISFFKPSYCNGPELKWNGRLT